MCKIYIACKGNKNFASVQIFNNIFRATASKLYKFCTKPTPICIAEQQWRQPTTIPTPFRRAGFSAPPT